MQIANKFDDTDLFDTAEHMKKSIDELRYALIGVTFDSDEPEELEVDNES